MSVCYEALIPGHLSAIDVAKFIQRKYGGDDFTIKIANFDGHYVIIFSENVSPADMKLNIFERNKRKNYRRMHVFTDGYCKGDYEEITRDPMTMLSLGRSGECEEILKPFVEVLGGWIKDEEVSHDWVRLP